MLVQKEDVYLNFVNSIKSDVTKRIYEYNLRLFMEFCGIDKFEDLIGEQKQNQIITYLMSLREKKLSYNSISTRLNAIYHFYYMNDISLNKKKIKMFKGEYTRKVVDRAYTHEDIKKILDYTVGLGKIYDPLEIEKKKLEPEFPREYIGQYLGRIGNVFSSSHSNLY